MICDRCGAEIASDATACANCQQEQGVGWACPSCGVRVPENFDVCWSCQTSRTGEASVVEPESRELPCLRCRSRMQYASAVDRYVAYACGSCGHVELFLPDVGNDRRPPVG